VHAGVWGYESPSQFSREYSRLFGAPPQRDVTRAAAVCIGAVRGIVSGMTLKRMDNVGVVVDDLAVAVAFFKELGLELEGEAQVEGRSVDAIVFRPIA